MSLGGCLEHQHKSFRSFERKFHLPAVKEVLSKRVDLEEYYKQRGVLGEYIKLVKISSKSNDYIILLGAMKSFSKLQSIVKAIHCIQMIMSLVM